MEQLNFMHNESWIKKCQTKKSVLKTPRVNVPRKRYKNAIFELRVIPIKIILLLITIFTIQNGTHVNEHVILWMNLEGCNSIKINLLKKKISQQTKYYTTPQL